MPVGPSLLSLSASGLYVCVMLVCLAAAITASQHRQLPSHLWTWLLLALLFGALMCLRLFDVEETIRSSLRISLRADGNYEERRSVQVPIVAAIIMLTAVGGPALIYRMTRRLRGRRNVVRVVATTAAFAMLFLIALRIVSLHAVDALLYGPVKLNWVIDFGASLTVLFGALTYIRLVRNKP